MVDQDHCAFFPEIPTEVDDGWTLPRTDDKEKDKDEEDEDDILDSGNNTRLVQYNLPLPRCSPRHALGSALPAPSHHAPRNTTMHCPSHYQLTAGLTITTHHHSRMDA